MHDTFIQKPFAEIEVERLTQEANAIFITDNGFSRDEVERRFASGAPLIIQPSEGNANPTYLQLHWEGYNFEIAIQGQNKIEMDNTPQRANLIIPSMDALSARVFPDNTGLQLLFSYEGNQLRGRLKAYKMVTDGIGDYGRYARAGSLNAHIVAAGYFAPETKEGETQDPPPLAQDYLFSFFEAANTANLALPSDHEQTDRPEKQKPGTTVVTTLIIEGEDGNAYTLTGGLGDSYGIHLGAEGPSMLNQLHQWLPEEVKVAIQDMRTQVYQDAVSIKQKEGNIDIIAEVLKRFDAMPAEARDKIVEQAKGNFALIARFETDKMRQSYANMLATTVDIGQLVALYNRLSHAMYLCLGTREVVVNDITRDTIVTKNAVQRLVPGVKNIIATDGINASGNVLADIRESAEVIDYNPGWNMARYLIDNASAVWDDKTTIVTSR